MPSIRAEVRVEVLLATKDLRLPHLRFNIYLEFESPTEKQHVVSSARERCLDQRFHPCNPKCVIRTIGLLTGNEDNGSYDHTLEDIVAQECPRQRIALYLFCAASAM